MIRHILISTLISLLVILCCHPKNSYAQAPSKGDLDQWIKESLPSFGGNITIGGVISAFLPYLFGLTGFFMFIYLVIGAYQVLISQGDPKQMAAGREKITYAIIGFIIMFSAFWIVRIIGEVLNIQQIKDIFG